MPESIASATSGFTGSIITQTVVVDIGSATAAAFFDDLLDYLRTHNVNLGPTTIAGGEN